MSVSYTHLILAGIITNTGLYTVNLMVMGWSSNVSLLKQDTMFTLFRDLGIGGGFYKLILAGGITMFAGAALVWFLGTRLGLSIRATGDNRDMVRASSVNPVFAITVGLCISNEMCIRDRYQCGKGLVADIFAEIDPERVKAFLERYRDLEEDRLTEEEQERIQQESPLETGFQPEIILNGRKLRGVEGNGLCWLPESCREMDAGALNDGPAEEYPELDNDGDPVEDPAAEEYPAADPYEEERRLLEHYGLDPAKAWSCLLYTSRCV